jgi:hypothetical protein
MTGKNDPGTAVERRRQWLPSVRAGHLLLPERHYRLLAGIRSRVFRRSAVRALPHTRIARQRELAIWLTAFSGIRTFVWLVAMGLIVAHWAGAGGAFLHWFTSLSGEVVFVTFISFYCNASTDAANLSASLAALFAADSHVATVTAGREAGEDLAGIEADIARLADMLPGDEAGALAASIRSRLAGNPPPNPRGAAGDPQV